MSNIDGTGIDGRNLIGGVVKNAYLKSHYSCHFNIALLGRLSNFCLVLKKIFTLLKY